MKSFILKTFFAGILLFSGFYVYNAEAQSVDSYYTVGSTYQQYPVVSSEPYYYNPNQEYINQLLQLIAQLQAQLEAQSNYGYNNSYPYYGNYNTYNPYTYTTTSGNNSYSNSDDRPDVDTKSARDIEDDSAELRGDVDMNDARNGIVFFVYGQDEDKIEDVEDDYDEYDDVRDDEEDDDFEVVKVDNDLDDDDSYDEEVDNLEEGEDYYFVICVEYDDEDGDETLECGDVEDFETDGDSDEEPDVETDSATDIDDDSAELRGDVDMNDYDGGRVFFVWGQDEDDVEDVEEEDSYSDVDENGDDLQKESVDNDFDGNDSFELNIYNLDDNTDYYFRICVEYEDDGNNDTLECGDVEDFETD